MSSPNSCLRCNAPLTVDSIDGLCPTCQAVADTPQLRPAEAPDASQPATATFIPVPQTTEPETSDSAVLAPATPRQAVPVTFATQAAHPEPPPGYQLLQRLGGGGMGDVFLARDVTADRLLAVKFLRASSNPVAVGRFTREVQALARLDDPHIVRVLGHDFYRTSPYFTMEYAPGGTLSEWTSKHGNPDPIVAARIIATVARAVHAAHAAGILHRDLKPSNILLRLSKSQPQASTSDSLTSCSPVVSDFGLAKLVDRNDSLTVSTGGMGTPGYLPPEQISSLFGEPDCRADVYGLGATLYSLLTGRPPFRGPEPEMLSQVMNTLPERPRLRHPDIPLALEAVVMKCLEKQPADRYPTAAAVAEDLERVVAGETPQAPTLTRSRRLRRWAHQNQQRLKVAAIVLVAAMGLVATGMMAAPIPPDSGADNADRLDPIEHLRRTLAAGQQVVLVDENGLCRYGHRRWVFGTGEFLSPDKPTAACWTREDALLELCPDPGIDRYHVALELRQVDSTSRAENNGDLGHPVGLYFGHNRQLFPDGNVVHTHSAFLFTDYTLNPKKRMRPGINYDDQILYIPPLQASSRLTRGVGPGVTNSAPTTPRSVAVLRVHPHARGD